METEEGIEKADKSLGLSGFTLSAANGPATRHAEQWPSVNKFRIIEELQSVFDGNFAVFRVEELVPSRDISEKILKMLRVDFCDEAVLKRILKIPHKNIQRYFTLERSFAGPHLWLLHERPQGVSLRSLLAERRLSQDEVLSYALQLLYGLEYLHGRSNLKSLYDCGSVDPDVEAVFHGTLTSDTLMIYSPERGLKITDIEFSKGFRKSALQSVKALDESRSSMFYLSPESIQFAAGYPTKLALNSRTDVWSFGCIFLQMISGRNIVLKCKGGQELTVKDAPLTILRARLDGAVPETGKIPDDHYLMKCLQGDPKSRPSVQTLLKELESLDPLGSLFENLDTDGQFYNTFSYLGQEVTYQKADCTDHGVFGKLYKATFQDEKGRNGIVMKSQLNRGKSGLFKLEWLIENRLLPRLSKILTEQTQSEFLAKYYAFYGPSPGKWDNHVTTISEHMEGESLDTLIQNKDGLPGKVVESITKQLLEGLQFLHHRAIIHTLLRPKTVMVYRQGRADCQIKINGFEDVMQLGELIRCWGIYIRTSGSKLDMFQVSDFEQTIPYLRPDLFYLLSQPYRFEKSMWISEKIHSWTAMPGGQDIDDQLASMHDRIKRNFMWKGKGEQIEDLTGFLLQMLPENDLWSLGSIVLDMVRGTSPRRTEKKIDFSGRVSGRVGDISPPRGVSFKHLSEEHIKEQSDFDFSVNTTNTIPLNSIDDYARYFLCYTEVEYVIPDWVDQNIKNAIRKCHDPNGNLRIQELLSVIEHSEILSKSGSNQRGVERTNNIKCDLSKNKI